MIQSYACLVFNQITFNYFASHALELHADGSDVRLYDGPYLKSFIKFVGAGVFCALLVCLFEVFRPGQQFFSHFGTAS